MIQMIIFAIHVNDLFYTLIESKVQKELHK